MPNGGQISAGTGLRLQATSPGAIDTGNFNISGTGYAFTFRTRLSSPADPGNLVLGSFTMGGRTPADWGAPVTALGEGMTLGSIGGNTVIGNSASSGSGITSSAQNCVIIGQNATWSGGYGSGQSSVVIGYNSSIQGGSQVVIGAASSATGNGATVIGASASSTAAAGNLIIGNGCNDAGLANVVNIGSGAAAPAANSITIGKSTQTTVKIGPYDLSQPTRFLFVQTANVTLANSVAETLIMGAGSGTRTIPANTLRAGSTVRIKAYGIIADTGTPTIHFRLKLGGTTFCDFGAASFPTLTGTHGFKVDAEITIRTAGAGGAAIGNGLITVSVNGAPDLDTTNTATSAVDTTAANVVDLTAQWGTANAANTLTLTHCSIEIIN